MRPSHEDLLTAQRALMSAVAKEGAASNVQASRKINSMIMQIEGLFFDPHQEENHERSATG